MKLAGRLQKHICKRKDNREMPAETGVDEEIYKRIQNFFKTVRIPWQGFHD